MHVAIAAEVLPCLANLVEAFALVTNSLVTAVFGTVSGQTIVRTIDSDVPIAIGGACRANPIRARNQRTFDFATLPAFARPLVVAVAGRVADMGDVHGRAFAATLNTDVDFALLARRAVVFRRAIVVVQALDAEQTFGVAEPARWGAVLIGNAVRSGFASRRVAPLGFLAVRVLQTVHAAVGRFVADLLRRAIERVRARRVGQALVVSALRVFAAIRVAHALFADAAPSVTDGRWGRAIGRLAALRPCDAVSVLAATAVWTLLVE